MSFVSRPWRRSRLPSFRSPMANEVRLPRLTSRRLLRLLPVLVLLALGPPIFFHFRLRRFNEMQSRKCGWLENPPLVCAHGGDSSKAFPNTMDAYRFAIDSHVDCIEIDISRSLDGVLLALHDRDLQRISGNATAKVGYMSVDEIKKLNSDFQARHESAKHRVLTARDALELVSKSVRQVIIDVKVGPPSYEIGLATDILSLVQKTNCRNCVVWAKSDIIGRDVIRLSPDILVGYIVMKDPSTGARSSILRMRGANIVGVYHPLIDKKLVRTLHRQTKKVYAWTVDDMKSMQKMLFERVDAIVTGQPSLLQGLMQNMKTECLEEGFSLP
ncbi:putative glycerophosphodiester phosphodiesterase [Dioscorea sansibarensis]